VRLRSLRSEGWGEVKTRETSFFELYALHRNILSGPLLRGERDRCGPAGLLSDENRHSPCRQKGSGRGKTRHGRHLGRKRWPGEPTSPKRAERSPSGQPRASAGPGRPGACCEHPPPPRTGEGEAQPRERGPPPPPRQARQAQGLRPLS